MISRRVLLGAVGTSAFALPHAFPEAAHAAQPTLRYLSRGEAVKTLQRMLAKYGYYALSIDGSFGRGTANAVLNYQRAQRLYDDAVVGSLTWGRLFRSPQPAVPQGVPSTFLAKSGTTLYADQRQRKLFVVSGGRIQVTYPARFGGFTRVENPYRADYRQWRVHRTPTGDYSVLTKLKNPSSAIYGEGAMPNSLVLIKGAVYIHGSTSFATEGYTGGSHGCINLRPAHAEALYARIGVGTRVYIRK